jgi:hypothetical protein
MEASISKTDWINNHLYLSHKFNKELNDRGIERLSDLEKLSLLDFMSLTTITVARLRIVVRFMHVNDLTFKSLG